MFGHVFKYGVKSVVRAKEVIFWSFIFPFALSTFMYLAFGDIFETTEKFHAIPTAIMSESSVLKQVFSALSEEGEKQVIQAYWVKEDEAERLLKDGTVKGIVYGTDMHLKVKENGMDETILKMILQQVQQNGIAVGDVAVTHPEHIQQVVDSFNDEVQYCIRKSYGSGNQDNVVNYFYAIFAMTCLFGSFASCDRVCKIQADVCALGQRRGVTPTRKMTIIITEFLVSECLQFIIVSLLLVYMKFVLKINVGDKYAAILLLLLLGSSLGTMIGVLVGSLPRLSQGIKIGCLVSVSLFFSACSDLMVSGVRSWLERHIPIANDINPAALICDSFYALNVYDTYDRFMENMTILAVMTFVLGVVSFLMVRRSKYASL